MKLRNVQIAAMILVLWVLLLTFAGLLATICNRKPVRFDAQRRDVIRLEVRS